MSFSSKGAMRQGMGNEIIDFQEEKERRRKKRGKERARCEMCGEVLSKKEERSGMCNICFEETMRRR